MPDINNRLAEFTDLEKQDAFVRPNSNHISNAKSSLASMCCKAAYETIVLKPPVPEPEYFRVAV